MSLLGRSEEIALGTQRPEDLATIVIEVAVLNTTTGDHDYVDGLGEVVTDSAKCLAQAALDLVPNVGALLYLCCNGDGEPAFIRCRWNYEQEKVLGVKFTPVLLAPVYIRSSSKPGLGPVLQR
ncbi:MAG: hypothetical protein RIS36_1371 [Pseudomonadota bacterium]|jgi:hypothetical protein